MEYITLPDGTTRIEQSAFKGCTSLENINLPNSINTIGDYAFNNCKLTSVIIPSSVTQLNNGVFHSCTSLESVTLHDGITSIGEAVFYENTYLTSINLPNSLPQ